MFKYYYFLIQLHKIVNIKNHKKKLIDKVINIKKKSFFLKTHTYFIFQLKIHYKNYFVFILFRIDIVNSNN